MLSNNIIQRGKGAIRELAGLVVVEGPRFGKVARISQIHDAHRRRVERPMRLVARCNGVVEGTVAFPAGLDMSA